MPHPSKAKLGKPLSYTGRLDYDKAPLESLIQDAENRLPSLTWSLHSFGARVPVMLTYNHRHEEFRQWQQQRLKMSCGTYRDARTAFKVLLTRLDEFGAEREKKSRDADAKKRRDAAQRRSAAVVATRRPPAPRQPTAPVPTSDEEKSDMRQKPQTEGI